MNDIFMNNLAANSKNIKLSHQSDKYYMAHMKFNHVQVHPFPFLYPCVDGNIFPGCFCKATDLDLRKFYKSIQSNLCFPVVRVSI